MTNESAKDHYLNILGSLGFAGEIKKIVRGA